MKYLLIIIVCLSVNVQAKSLSGLMKDLTKAVESDDEIAYSGSYVEVVNPPNGNHRIKDFNHAKRIMKETHYMGATKTGYCNCPMTSWNTFTNKGCGYVNDKYDKIWHKIEYEHLVPLSRILENTKAYKVGHPSCGFDKGRKCVEKVYGFVSGDLYVSLPSETELNRVHSNHQWAELGSKGKKFGTCDFYYADKKVQPPQHLKGLIARAYMYVEDVYKVKVISNKNKKLFEIWASYPPSQDQCQRAKNIMKIQGNENKFETAACKKAGLW